MSTVYLNNLTLNHLSVGKSSAKVPKYLDFFVLRDKEVEIFKYTLQYERERKIKVNNTK